MKTPGLRLPVSNNERAPRSLTPYGLCTFVRQLDLAVRLPARPSLRHWLLSKAALPNNIQITIHVNMQPSSAAQRSASAEGPVTAAQRYGTIWYIRGSEDRLKLAESVRHLDTHGGKSAFCLQNATAPKAPLRVQSQKHQKIAPCRPCLAPNPVISGHERGARRGGQHGPEVYYIT